MFEYLYRDASNYKAFRSVVLDGEWSQDLIEGIRSSLIDGEYFVPQMVGLEPLQAQVGKWNSDDHDWHEVVEFRQLDADVAVEIPNRSAADLVAAFRSMPG